MEAYSILQRLPRVISKSTSIALYQAFLLVNPVMAQDPERIGAPPQRLAHSTWLG